MKNIFDVIVDRNTQKIESEYKHWIIRNLNKKQEEKIQTLGKTYSSAQQGNGVPKWVYMWTRISSTLVYTSFIFFFVMLLMTISKGLDKFFMEYLWLEILFGIGIISRILALIVNRRFSKGKKLKKNNAEDIFETILDTSKQYLNIPQNALNIEVLSLKFVRKNDTIKAPKHKIHTNVVLSVFLEENKLCFADLYDVIGIPLTYLKDINEIEDSYQFKYWHKKEEYSTIQGITFNRRITCYEGLQQYQLVFKKDKEELEIRIPGYEIENLNKLLEGRMNHADITSKF